MLKFDTVLTTKQQQVHKKIETYSGISISFE